MRDNVDACFEVVHKINEEIAKLTEAVTATCETQGEDKPTLKTPLIEELKSDTETLLSYLEKTDKRLIYALDKLLGTIPRAN